MENSIRNPINVTYFFFIPYWPGVGWLLLAQWYWPYVQHVDHELSLPGKPLNVLKAKAVGNDGMGNERENT